MNFTQMNEQLYVSEQIDEDDIAELVRLGIRTVICHRLDGEDVGQPNFADLAAKIRAAGIKHTYHQPIASVAAITQDTARLFAHILQESELPALAFCRSGRRSAIVCALLQNLDD
ncbi:MAG: TIGR01244 family phosphatase [Neisseriaceae bacterium]|nr:TIGR01244 family phosphatase [Neisseriaceae bacterium]